MGNRTAEGRASREADTREAGSRTMAWKPPTTLPDPTPQEGYRFRWIRTSTLGDADTGNVSMRMREGWEPVRAEDHPELMLRSDRDSKFAGNIEVGGLLLCKCPEEDASARQRYYEGVARQQLQAVDANVLKEQDPRMPILTPERSSRVTTGSGDF